MILDCLCTSMRVDGTKAASLIEMSSLQLASNLQELRQKAARMRCDDPLKHPVAGQKIA